MLNRLVEIAIGVLLLFFIVPVLALTAFYLFVFDPIERKNILGWFR